jgi:alpha-1,6-mannosyltransferase
VAMACRRRRPQRAAFAAAAVGLNPVIVVHTVGGGHNDAIIAALLAGALVLVVARREGLKEWRTRRALAITELLSLAALVKIVVGLALLVWLWVLVASSDGRDRVRAVLTHLALSAALSVALMAPFLSGWRTLSPLGTAAGLQGWASGARLVARGANALGGSVASKAILGLFVLAFLGFFIRIVRRSSGATIPNAWGVSLLLFGLSAPYLTPWYAAWFVPFLAFFADEAFTILALALTSLLALTGVPAEPASSPGLWHDMLLAVHYVAAPIVLAMFLIAAARLLKPEVERSSPPAWRKHGQTRAAPPGPERPAPPG